MICSQKKKVLEKYEGGMLSLTERRKSNFVQMFHHELRRNLFLKIYKWLYSHVTEPSGG